MKYAQMKARICRLEEALRQTIYPNAPSADDIMLMGLASGFTSKQQEEFRPYVEQIQERQENARKLLQETTTP